VRPLGKSAVLLTVLRDTYAGWQRHHTAHLAAALSFYLAFSLAPLLVITIAIAGLVLGQRAATQDVLGPLSGFVGPSAARFVTRLVAGLGQPAHNVLAASIGVAALLVGASAAFAMLHDAMNIIFDSPQRPAGVWQVVRVRAVAFVMVLAIGMLLLATQVFNAALAANAALAQNGAHPYVRGPVEEFAGFLVSFVLMTGLCAALFRFVHDARIAWRDALVGGALTALLFLLGQWLLSLYIHHSAFSSIHGAAAAALIIMTWLYYSSQAVFFGAEFTRAYAFNRRQGALPLDEPDALAR
jgi:membrane protein